jgi:phosphoglycolate phosphatase-like HAD superfamily hydrolase
MRCNELLIFDFDGTIVDSRTLYYNIIYDELKKYGFSYDEIVSFIDMGLNLSRTLEKIGLSFFKRIILGRKIMRNVRKDLNKVTKCKDVDCIKGLRKQKILMSNSSKKAILPILRYYKLKRCFKKIYGAEDFADKAKFIREYLKRKDIPGEKCYYIGDRIADVNVAKEARCNSIIVCGKCAWDSPKDLLEAEPDFIVSSIKDIKEIVQGTST